MKRDIRAFERWFTEVSHTWPEELRAKAQLALLALKTRDQPNVPDIMTREAAKDMADFLEAYGAWKAKGSE